MFAGRLFVPREFSCGDEISVPEVVEIYLARLKARVEIDDYDRDAYSNVQRELRLFAAAHTCPVSDCRQNDLTRWLEVNPAWKSGHTKKRIISGIIGCFRWAAEEQLIPACPYRRIKAVSELPYTPRRPAEHAEYIALMRGSSRPLRRALFFLRRTGARTKEMRELRWPDCHLDTSSPFVVIKSPKTRRKTGQRKIGLDAGTANFLCALRRQAKDLSGLVFTNCDGNPWTRRVFSKHLRRWAERLGLDEGVEKVVSAYCLRHLYAVDGIEANISTRRIADQLGHAQTDMIDKVYGSHTREREEHLANVAKDVQLGRKRR